MLPSFAPADCEESGGWEWIKDLLQCMKEGGQGEELGD